jgi:hypothetical protein
MSISRLELVQRNMRERTDRRPRDRAHRPQYRSASRTIICGLHHGSSWGGDSYITGVVGIRGTFDAIADRKEGIEALDEG